MSDKKTKKLDNNEQQLVVKNKKYKKGDILAFALCLLAALFIWVYATNVEANPNRTHDEPTEHLVGISDQK